MEPTDEQRAALEAFATGDDLVITAGAGTGKTATLRMLAESQNSPGVYIAFNRSIADEARGRFPRRVQARTAHSFAAGWARSDAIGARVLDRLKDRPPFQGVVDLLDLEPMTVQTAGGQRTFTTWDVGRWVQGWVRAYCQSADEDLGPEHFPYVPGLVDPAVRASVAKELLPAAQRAWADMTSPTGVCRVGHEVYLKLWQLSRPTLPGSFVLFDEAQDASPVMSAVVAAQASQKVYVGDESQAIYRFTGARDAMHDLEAAHRVQLTRSWRFGPGIADAANTILSVLDAELRLTGTPDRHSQVYDVCPQPAAVLCRNNATTIAEIISAQQRGAATHLLGGTKDALAFVDGAQRLIERGSSSHPELAWFSSWGQAQEYAEEDPHGGEIATLVHLVDTYGTETLTRALRACVPTEAQPALTVSTAHKAKGREWDAVDLADDFHLEEPVRDISSPGETGALARDELMLGYVAVTRARHALGAGVLADALDKHGFPPLAQIAPQATTNGHDLPAGVVTDHCAVRERTITISEAVWQAYVEMTDDPEMVLAGQITNLIQPLLADTLDGQSIGDSSDPRLADAFLGKPAADLVRSTLVEAVNSVAPTRDLHVVTTALVEALHGLGLELDSGPTKSSFAVAGPGYRLLLGAFGIGYTGHSLLEIASCDPQLHPETS